MSAVIGKDPGPRKIRTFAMRLSVSSPRSLLPELHSWKGAKLVARDDTVAWTAAHKFLGDNWKKSTAIDLAKETDAMDVDVDDADDEPEDNETANPVTPEIKKVGFAQAGINKFFLSKQLRKKHNYAHLDDAANARNHKLYIKTRLPKVMIQEDGEAEKEVVASFNAMCKKFFQIDRKAVIHPWNNKKTVKPLIDGSTLPKTRNQMETYVDRVFIQYNKAAYCRLKIGFDIDEDIFFKNEWFSANDYWYDKDELQTKITMNCGWLVGSFASTDANSKDLGEALRQHPLIMSKGIDVATRIHAIRISQQERPQKEDMVRAVHIYCDYNKVAVVREVVRRIYKEGQKKGYPLGIKMRFVPNIADPRYPVTAATKANIKVLSSKQKRFLKNIRQQKSHNIQGLDFFIDKYGVTLRQKL